MKTAQTLPASTSDPTTGPLERSAQLAELGESLEAVRSSLRGRLVLVGGEAGVGKTALVQRFCEERGRSARILWGACDALFAPPPLAPFRDVARTTGGYLARLVEDGARPSEVAAALTVELRTQAPTIVVLEDMHWADEATLDVLRLVGRRIRAVPALVLASYRDDELDRAHPLRIVIGELATGEAIHRMKLPPLSHAAVAKLAEPHGVDPDELYRRTIGNPFFVTEVLAAGGVDIPDTVRDAVLARAARLTPGARTLLEAVAIAPPQIELWLLEALAGDLSDRLEECLTSGMLKAESTDVAFRHELARLAIEESTPPDRRVRLHQRTVTALAGRAGGPPDFARLAHHAEGAGEAEEVLQFAPAAAARAASLGAHREAAAQYARTLRFADGLSLDVRAELFERLAQECYLTDQTGDAIEALQNALDCYRRLGNRLKEGDSLRRLSLLLWCPGRLVEAWDSGRKAVALLEQLPPGHELAMAYSHLSSLYAGAEDMDGTVSWAARAIDLGERLGDREALADALGNVGTMEFAVSGPQAREKLERSLTIAQEVGLEEQVANAFANLAWAATRHRAHALADRYLSAGLEYCSQPDLDLWRLYLLGFRVRSELDRGRWAEAVDSAALVLRDPRSSPLPRIQALLALGLVRARRGDPECWAPIDQAFAMAEPAGELQWIAPVAAARAEALWLEGRSDQIAEATKAAFDLAVRRRSCWLIGELGYWRWRAGIEGPKPSEAAEPYALMMAGGWARAAELWTQMGCPYEAALALADADDDQALRRALDRLQRMGAGPAATIAARRLRERGVRDLPRGPRRGTLENPANLTRRELDVLTLVAEGLTNAEIAQRLFLSAKTVDHHVSAVLRKLGAHTRGQASAEAARLGLSGQAQ